MIVILDPDPFCIMEMTAEEFILGMISLGKPVEVSIVGAFENPETKGRGSLRDIELPLHQDGVYSAKLAEAQGGTYVEKPGINFVGLYCVREGDEPCYTIIQPIGGGGLIEVNLKKGEALIFDNRRVIHGRRGPVGSRILIRFWVT